ncbi:MAG TPA: flagellar basal body rod protein FlgC [Methylococcaceae bacterium]|nr:flagellar basal body rod protein FlgC [Methylococcaceae bacterium]
MNSFRIFDVAASAMSAQSQRLNLVASNLANANTVSSSADQTYRSRQPVFAAALQDAMGNSGPGEAPGVKMLGVVENRTPLQMEYAPDHPMANEEGYIFKANVNTVEEMTNMISASRSYQDNVEVFNTAKQLMLQTLRLGE